MTDFEIAVLKRFGTRENCERFMKWASGAVSKVSKGKRRLTMAEAEKLAKEFEVNDFVTFKAIFFNLSSAKR